MIRGVCFDMDGVLLDTERLCFPMMRKALAMQGEELSYDRWKTLLGVNLAHTCASLAEWYENRVDAQRFFHDWVDVTFEYVHQHGVPKKDGADEILRYLREKGIGIALCTSNDVHVVEEYLQLTDWENAFDAIITGDQVGQGKPAPDIYRLGAARLGLNPSACVGVEDSANGLKSAKAAGLYSIMIPDLLPYTDALAPYVDQQMNQLTELKALFEEKEI